MIKHGLIKKDDFLYARIKDRESILKIKDIDSKTDMLHYEIVASSDIKTVLGNASFSISKFTSKLDSLDFCTIEDWQKEWSIYNSEAENYMQYFKIMKPGSFYSFIDPENSVYISKVLGVERNFVAIETHTKDHKGKYVNNLETKFLVGFGDSERKESSARIRSSEKRVVCERDHIYKVAKQGGSISQELMDTFSITRDNLVSYLNPPMQVIGDLFLASSVAFLGSKLLGNVLNFLPVSHEQKKLDKEVKA